MPAIAAALMRR